MFHKRLIYLSVASTILLPIPVIIQAQTLMLYYDFEQGSGTIITNRGASLTSGNLLGAGGDSRWVGGAPGSSTPAGGFEFDGSSDVNLMDHIETGITTTDLGMDEDGYTAAAWIRLDDATGSHYLFGQTGSQAVQLGIRTSYVSYSHTGADSRCYYNIDSNTWNHIAWVYADGAQYVYVNGERCSGPIDNRLFRDVDPLIIGRGRSNSEAFAGIADDLVIYDAPLDENQLQHLAQGGDPTSLPAGTRPLPDLEYFTAPYGPNGTWNLYAIVGGDRGERIGWYEAHVDAVSRIDPLGSSGKPGHLVWINSSNENHFVRNMTRRNSCWIGLTDDSLFGGTEAGTHRQNGWAWAGNGVDTPPAFDFALWDDNQPTDSGTSGEDAVELRNTGYWNDSRSSIPGSNQAPFSRRYAIEWEVGASGPIPGAVPLTPLLPEFLPGTESIDHAWGITEIKHNGTFNLIEQAVVSAVSEQGTISTGHHPVINFVDPDDPVNGGEFALTSPILSNTPDPDHQMVVIAKARVWIDELGTYTFGVRCQDGMALRILDANWVRADGNLMIDPRQPNTLFSSRYNDAANGEAQVVLDQGYYTLEFVAYEQGDGLYWQVFSAKGAFTDFDETDTWRLVGFAPVPGGMNPSILSAGNEGWFVRMSDPGGSNVGDLQEAALEMVGVTNSTTWQSINFEDPQSRGSGGLFDDGAPFPLDTSSNDDDFAIMAEAQLQIPADGAYWFGFQSDDGAYLEIEGQTWDHLVESIINTTVISGDRIICDCNTGNSRAIGQITLDAGIYTIRALMFDQGGGANFEIFGAAAGQSIKLLETNRSADFDDFPGLSIVDGRTATIPITRLESIPGSDAFSVQWTSSSNRIYVVESSTNLVDWVETSGPLTATGRVSEVQIPLAPFEVIRISAP